MAKWETTMPQVTEEERKDVLDKVEVVKKWIEEKEAAQAAADPASDPVFTSEEVPLQTKEIQVLVSKLSRRPKPVPKKEKKNETDTKSEKKNETDEKEEVKEINVVEGQKEKRTATSLIQQKLKIKRKLMRISKRKRKHSNRK